ncbi:unnamed protein product [Protopolystoma xenopodis]|uniref:Uncharacterized protein n=1 Tax=Protopolystoma xenopodis TaxID=117903 RepID=A0A448X902_9PLAT|nr:unnamed protein product [Protopolystoma xenopodis]
MPSFRLPASLSSSNIPSLGRLHRSVGRCHVAPQSPVVRDKGGEKRERKRGGHQDGRALYTHVRMLVGHLETCAMPRVPDASLQGVSRLQLQPTLGT